VLADEPVQGGLVARVFVLAERRVPAPGEAVEVGRGKRQARRRIVLMKAEEVLVEANGPDHGGGLGGQFPGQKLGGRAENRAFG
jgi:hypothetical protein